MKAGIAVDDRKLPVFRKILTDAGYTYEDKGPLTHNTTLLMVQTDDLAALATVVTQCQSECRK